MFQKITRKNLEKFLQRYSTDKRVLDIGSGGSSYQRFFPNRLTVDIDPARKPEIIADAHHLPFKDGEFETVLCTEGLEHVKDPFRVEREIRRVTKLGGQLILSTRFVFPLHDTPHDYWRFTKYGLREIFKEWEVIELTEETRNFSTMGALFQRICFQSELRFNKVSKFFILSFAWLLDHMNFLTVKEYGDIKHSKSESLLMPTGYYIVCRKRL
ncbi:MAG TPA: class I SAM-dependent methyltransferase [Candidatus Paceibacterota bacterium]|nr:class I SAM-dependent methyltransferase [Candidatus Paceibacterota bacterium]